MRVQYVAKDPVMVDGVPLPAGTYTGSRTDLHRIRPGEERVSTRRFWLELTENQRSEIPEWVGIVATDLDCTLNVKDGSLVVIQPASDASP
jgi:hypothetical protein